MVSERVGWLIRRAHPHLEAELSNDNEYGLSGCLSSGCCKTVVGGESCSVATGNRCRYAFCGVADSEDRPTRSEGLDTLADDAAADPLA